MSHFITPGKKKTISKKILPWRTETRIWLDIPIHYKRCTFYNNFHIADKSHFVLEFDEFLIWFHLLRLKNVITLIVLLTHNIYGQVKWKPYICTSYLMMLTTILNCKRIFHELLDVTYTWLLTHVSSIDIFVKVLPFDNMYSVVQISVF